MKALTNSKKLFLYVIFLFLCISLSYVFFVADLFSYLGFYVNVKALKMAEAVLFSFFSYLILPKKGFSVSSISIGLLYVFALLPLNVFYALADAARPFMYIWNAGFVVVCLTIIVLPRVKWIKFVSLRPIYWILIVAISSSVYFLLHEIHILPRLKLFTLGSEVYNIRENVALPGIMDYLVYWQAFVINPFLISLTLYRRRIKLTIFVISGQALLFLLTAQKQVIFIPGFVFLIWLVYKKRLNFMKMLIIVIIFAILMSLALYVMNGNLLFPSMFIRRVFFSPAKVSFHYYEFFSQNPFTYLSQSSLGFVTGAKNPYPNWSSIPKMMGNVFYPGDSVPHMNTGFIGSAYMNIGLPGVIIFSFLLGYILKILDSASKGMEFIAASTVAFPVFTLVNGSLLTTLGTRGLLLGVLIIIGYSINHKQGFL